MSPIALADAVAPRTLIIRARALADLQRLLPATDEPVTLAVTPNGGQVVIRCGASEVMSRLIDGQFPDLQRVIPQSYATRAVVDRQALRGAVKQAAVFAASKITRLTLDGTAASGAGRLTVASPSTTRFSKKLWRPSQRRSWRSRCKRPQRRACCDPSATRVCS